MSSIVLKPGRERSVRNRHPWIFSGAIARSAPVDADEVDVYSDDGILAGARVVEPVFANPRPDYDLGTQ